VTDLILSHGCYIIYNRVVNPFDATNEISRSEMQATTAINMFRI